MADLSINDITTGYSFTGAVEYLNLLNRQAIIETKNKLADIDGIRAALEKGWVGQAEINFIANLQNSVEAIQGTLDTLKRVLDGQFAQIEENMVEQDQNMVPLN
ncbi:MAG: hypothetical protein ACM3O4_05955 [Ignavibacteriales bacterium]